MSRSPRSHKFDGQPPAPPDGARNGADRRPRRAAPARRDVRRAGRGRAGRVHARGSAGDRGASLSARSISSIGARASPISPVDRRADRQPGGAARAARAARRAARRSISRVLKRLAEEDWVRDRVARAGDGRAALGGVRRCPISASSAPIRMRASSAALFGHLSEGDGHIPHQWFAERGRAARRRDRRCRDDRRAHRGDAQLGLYRAPRRLAGRPGALGRARAGRSRSGCPTRSTPA